MRATRRRSWGNRRGMVLLGTLLGVLLVVFFLFMRVPSKSAVVEAVFLEIQPVGPLYEELAFSFSRPSHFGHELHRGGKFRLAYAFNDHMVLQRAPEQAVVWGWCAADDIDCEVVLQYEELSFLATLEGSEIVKPFDRPQIRWSFELPLHTAGGPLTLLIFNSQGEGLAVQDVYFGDVYHCAGQSNMLLTVAQTFTGREHAEEGETFDFPLIRVMDLGRKDSKEELADMETAPSLPWTVSSHETIRDVSEPFTHFSAICWFFGKAMYEELHVPIGLVSFSNNGSPLQTWCPPSVLTECGSPASNFPQDECCPTEDSITWFGTVHPVVRLKKRAVLWYQGESNVFEPNF